MSKRRKRRGSSANGFLPAIIIVVLIVIVVVIGVVSFVFGPAAASVAAARSVGTDFMTALQANDYTTAYGLLTSTYQAVFGDADEMQTDFTEAGWGPSSFSLTQVQAAPNGKTVLTGTGTFGGATKYISMFLQKTGNTWGIVGFMTADDPPTAIPSA